MSDSGSASATNRPSARAIRETLALWLAPWLYVPHREDRDEAFRRLAEVAYGSRNSVWTCPLVLVNSALSRARDEGRRTA